MQFQLGSFVSFTLVYIYMYIHTSVSLYYIRLTEIKLDLCCLMRCGLAVVVVVLIGEHQLTHMSTENPELITHVDVRKKICGAIGPLSLL